VTPIWTKLIVDAVKKSVKTCPHCQRKGTYERKRPGQFHKCRHCGHRFKEKQK
jgi:ribosomal protein L37AE/L43A